MCHSYIIKEEFGYREVLNIADKFAVGVASSPEKLNCHHQNRPMNQVNETTDLKAFPEEIEKTGVLNFLKSI